MKLEGITNASVLVTLADGRTVLCDPWYSDGVCYGSWYNFPPLADPARYTSLRPDAIYISHLHQDHLDPDTLARYPRQTEIWIGKLPHDHLERAIRGLGFQNITSFELERPTEHRRLVLTFFGDFAPTVLGAPDAVDYAIDTSILIRDADGTTLFNVNDNTIQVPDARRVAERFGSPDLSLVPCSGASLYPHAFPDYPHEEKLELKRQLTQQMIERFLGVCETLGSRWIVPAAGSYVMGGSIAHYSAYLHQPTPATLLERWNERGIKDSELVNLCEGDVLDTASGALTENPAARFRDFTEEERTAYALTLADRPLLHEELSLPGGARFSWAALLKSARANLWRHQERLAVFPEWDVELHLGGLVEPPFRFRLDAPEPTAEAAARAGRGRIAFELDHRLLLLVLIRAAHWNNVEAGALVRIRRDPDRYEPSIHSLMSFLQL